MHPKGSLPSLAKTHAVTIQVVNLWYPDANLLRNNPGFGYLVPSSTPDNHAGVLGVLFDSEMQTREGEPGTKLTVMLGGHHWDDWTYLPTPEAGVQIAISTVERALGIPPHPDMRFHSRMCKECLPQHYVGHRELMADAHRELLKTFDGRLLVAGPSYTNAGVMPAMRAGMDVAMRVARGVAQPWFVDDSDSWWDYHSQLRPCAYDHIGQTGLAGFALEHPRLVFVDRKDLYFRKSSGPHRRYTDSEGQWLHKP